MSIFLRLSEWSRGALQLSTNERASTRNGGQTRFRQFDNASLHWRYCHLSSTSLCLSSDAGEREVRNARKFPSHSNSVFSSLLAVFGKWESRSSDTNLIDVSLSSGENGPTAYILEKVDDSTSRFTWLLNVDLKVSRLPFTRPKNSSSCLHQGWLPQYLINSSLANVQLTLVESLRKYLTTSDMTSSLSSSNGDPATWSCLASLVNFSNVIQLFSLCCCFFLLFFEHFLLQLVFYYFFVKIKSVRCCLERKQKVIYVIDDDQCFLCAQPTSTL